MGKAPNKIPLCTSPRREQKIFSFRIRRPSLTESRARWSLAHLPLSPSTSTHPEMRGGKPGLSSAMHKVYRTRAPGLRGAWGCAKPFVSVAPAIYPRPGINNELVAHAAYLQLQFSCTEQLQDASAHCKNRYHTWPEICFSFTASLYNKWLGGTQINSPSPFLTTPHKFCSLVKPLWPAGSSDMKRSR